MVSLPHPVDPTLVPQGNSIPKLPCLFGVLLCDRQELGNIQYLEGGEKFGVSLFLLLFL